mmetsp:Transcript_21879/g.85755  ORF Transcript_21879/g.85755 Transcript_21879/m.85755 type:complete len:270 (-) Transcript_21879:1074-1883(-)
MLLRVSSRSLAEVATNTLLRPRASGSFSSGAVSSACWGSVAVASTSCRWAARFSAAARCSFSSLRRDFISMQRTLKASSVRSSSTMRRSLSAVLIFLMRGSIITGEAVPFSGSFARCSQFSVSFFTESFSAILEPDLAAPSPSLGVAPRAVDEPRGVGPGLAAPPVLALSTLSLRSVLRARCLSASFTSTALIAARRCFSHCFFLMREPACATMILWPTSAISILFFSSSVSSRSATDSMVRATRRLASRTSSSFFFLMRHMRKASEKR